MDIFEFALQLETDSEQYYREQAEKTKYDDLKVVLEGLAEDERRHYKILAAMRDQFPLPVDDASAAEKNTIFDSFEQDFTKLKNMISIEKLKEEQVDLYRVALGKEHESVALYQKMRGAAADAGKQKVFDRLIAEEQHHAEVLDSIINMLNHVRDWVESAEFNHKDDY